MKWVLNTTFLKFFIGFITIILISLAITSFVAQISDEDIDKDTQTACQEGENC